MKKSKKEQGYHDILVIVSKSKRALKRRKDVTQKELDRVEKIFKTVYQHATKHGQDHSDALKYCLNVYKDQAPKWAIKIVNDVVRETKAMRISENFLRSIIREELHMSEADIINFPKKPGQKTGSGTGAGEVLAPEFGMPKMPEELPETRNSFNDAILRIVQFIEDEIEQGSADNSLTDEQIMFLEEIADDFMSESDEFDSSVGDFDDSEENIKRMKKIERELLTSSLNSPNIPEEDRQRIMQRLEKLNRDLVDDDL